MEWVKVALPSIVTLAVAFLAVSLALRRYKSEKIWERQLLAYADLCVALRELESVLTEWREETLQHREPSDEWRSYQSERYRTSRRGITTARAVADLLLPAATFGLLRNLERQLEDSHGLDPFARYEDQLRLIDAALSDIISHGRELLGIRNRMLKGNDDDE